MDSSNSTCQSDSFALPQLIDPSTFAPQEGVTIVGLFNINNTARAVYSMSSELVSHTKDKTFGLLCAQKSEPTYYLHRHQPIYLNPVELAGLTTHSDPGYSEALYKIAPRFRLMTEERMEMKEVENAKDGIADSGSILGAPITLISQDTAINGYTSPSLFNDTFTFLEEKDIILTVLEDKSNYDITIVQAHWERSPNIALDKQLPKIDLIPFDWLRARSLMAPPDTGSLSYS